LFLINKFEKKVKFTTCFQLLELKKESKSQNLLSINRAKKEA